MAQFDYTGTLKDLEDIAIKVEDPATPIEKIEEYIRLSDKKVAEAKEYLRTIKTNIPDD